MKKSGFKYLALPKSSGPGRLTINLPPSSKEDSDWKKLRGYGVASALESTRVRRGTAEQLDGARMHRFDEEMDGVAATVVLYALDRVRLDPPPIDMPKTKAELDKLGPTVTPEGLGGMEALRLFCEDLAPATISQDHPRNIAFVPSAPTEAAVLFDLVVGATSIYGGSWMEGSGAVWAENQALR
jgi:hypothetical protein